MVEINNHQEGGGGGGALVEVENVSLVGQNWWINNSTLKSCLTHHFFVV